MGLVLGLLFALVLFLILSLRLSYHLFVLLRFAPVLCLVLNLFASLYPAVSFSHFEVFSCMFVLLSSKPCCSVSIVSVWFRTAEYERKCAFRVFPGSKFRTTNGHFNQHHYSLPSTHYKFKIYFKYLFFSNQITWSYTIQSSCKIIIIIFFYQNKWFNRIMYSIDADVINDVCFKMLLMPSWKI